MEYVKILKGGVDENYGCPEPLFFNHLFNLQSPLSGYVNTIFI